MASSAVSRRRTRPASALRIAHGQPRDRAAGLRTLAKYGLRPGAFHTLADRVDCPVLIVHGSNDHYVPPAFALAAVARHPAWQLKLIAGAGHFPHRDHPSAWLGIVDPWLQRL